jgi:hypothetical protein
MDKIIGIDLGSSGIRACDWEGKKRGIRFNSFTME